MKLGTQTNSLINHLHARGTRGQPTPEVGMGATILGWTDRYPATIIAVRDRKDGGWDIDVQEDNCKRTDKNGFSEMQNYDYSPNPNGYVSHYRFVPTTGRWVGMRLNAETGRWNVVRDGNGLRIGQREKYHDFSF
jgi:hypothetical protein